MPEHAHDWPVLSLFVLGAYTNQTETGEAFICGPSAIFYPAGAPHRNIAGPDGFEQIEIEFDPAWLGPDVNPDDSMQRWIGSSAGVEAKSLARRCAGNLTESRLRAAVRRFVVHRATQKPARPPADWLREITRRLRNDPELKIGTLAGIAKRHPSWLGEAYKRATGEGLLETAARLRVERAARLLRETDLSFAHVAVDAGFCDQSHMNRTFRRILDRSPSAVRADKFALRQN